jgi:hypothetical protein
MYVQSTADTHSFIPDHRTSPDAVMKLFLRFDTPDGPRTVVAPNVPLRLATHVAAAMSRAGLHAEYVEQCDRLSVAERLELKKREEKINGARDHGNVIAIAMGPDSSLGAGWFRSVGESSRTTIGYELFLDKGSTPKVAEAMISFLGSSADRR